MADYLAIYKDHPERYDELVRAEDAAGNLRASLESLIELKGSRGIEAGAGTGRVTKILLESGVASLLATEVEEAMLTLAEHRLSEFTDPSEFKSRVQFEQADVRKLPAPDDSADFSIAGWVLGHLRHWHPDGWRTQIGAAVDELERVVKPQGKVIIIETLGTGAEVPAPPNLELSEYYEWLEGDRGYARASIRTDYEFPSVDDAARITGFFFGDGFSKRVRHGKWTTVPECTGLWSRIVP